MQKAAALSALLLMTSALAQKTVTIGWTGAITGPLSEVGSSYGAGVEDYCKYANAQKLLPDTTINCLVKDDSYDNARTQKNFEGFLAQKALVFMNFSTGSTLALKPAIQAAKIPTISGSYHIGNIEGANSDYIYLPAASYSEQLVSLIEYVAKRERGASVALVVNPSPFGRAPVDDVKDAAKRLGVKIVAVEEAGNDTDPAALLGRIKAAGARYVIHQNTAGPVANILNTAAKLGLTGTMQHMGSHYTGGDDLVKLAGDNAANFLWATSFYTYEEPGQPGIALARQIGRQFNRPQDTVRSVHYASGMLAASLAIEAIRRAGKDPTTASVNKALEAMVGSKQFNPGFTVGPVSLSSKDHVGTENVRLLMANGNGKYIVVMSPQRSKLFQLVHSGK